MLVLMHTDRTSHVFSFLRLYGSDWKYVVFTTDRAGALLYSCSGEPHAFDAFFVMGVI